MGDPASIGPEIAVKALLNEKIYAICRPILVGDAAVFTPVMFDNAKASRKNTVPIFEKWVSTKPTEL